ncbi:MAG TPA: M67 family metallopeptidase [Anaerolineae bacterium]|nr:M67 family metallopeptidase [Anaerolineae bacterium]
MSESANRRDALVIPEDLFDEMLAHLRGDPTQERCGLLVGDGDRVARVLPIPNALRSPARYFMDGQELADALLAYGEPLAIYHSHLSGPPTPSPTDVAEATYPDSYYVIVSFHVEPPSARAFRIRDGQVAEVELRIDQDN